VSAPARAERVIELLDQPRHDRRELEQSLSQIATVNQWLGGERALLKHVTRLLSPTQPTRILDIGTGSADLPRSIVEWARRHGRAVEIVAADLHPQIRAVAAARCRNFPEISIQAADALELPYAADSFDIVTISLTLHHFDDGHQLQVLRELARVSRGTVIVNELRRTHLNYAGARLLAVTLWRGNRLTRHDGPVSVLRAFTAAELTRLCIGAGMRGRVHRHYFQRLILVAHVR
jgi:ubiquinone/menaquinone biosynthesis C-methylase UbiE